MTYEEEWEFVKKVDKNDDFTKENILAMMVAANTIGDQEIRHSCLDDLLCQFVRGLGHGDVVDEWDKEGKWYA